MVLSASAITHFIITNTFNAFCPLNILGCEKEERKKERERERGERERERERERRERERERRERERERRERERESTLFQCTLLLLQTCFCIVFKVRHFEL